MMKKETRTVFIPGELFMMLAKFGDPETLIVEAVRESIQDYKNR